MKSLKAVFCVFAVMIFALSAASFASTARDFERSRSTPGSGRGSIEGAAEQEPAERVYIVRLEGDSVRVYERGSDVPLGRLAVDPRALPEADLMLLDCGILAEGDAQLLALIEDYGS